MITFSNVIILLSLISLYTYHPVFYNICFLNDLPTVQHKTVLWFFSLLDLSSFMQGLKLLYCQVEFMKFDHMYF